MAIALNTIQAGNIYAKHSSGAIAIPTAVVSIGNGQWAYTFQRNWQASDSGVWEVWSSPDKAVLDDKGNAVVGTKLGELRVDIIGVTQYIVVVPWDSMTTRLYVESNLPPDETMLGWRHWHWRTIDTARNTVRSRLYYRSVGDQTAILLLDTTFPLIISHATAENNGDGTFTQKNITPLNITYALTATNNYMAVRITVPGGALNEAISQWVWRAYSAAGVELNNAFSTITSPQDLLNCYVPAGTVKGTITLTWVDTTRASLTYEIPMS